MCVFESMRESVCNSEYAYEYESENIKLLVTNDAILHTPGNIKKSPRLSSLVHSFLFDLILLTPLQM